MSSALIRTNLVKGLRRLNRNNGENNWRIVHRN